jgi:hypothetical protein
MMVLEIVMLLFDEGSIVYQVLIMALGLDIGLDGG